MKKEYEYTWEIFEVLDEKIIWPWQKFWLREYDYKSRATGIDANMKYDLGKYIFNYIEELNLTIINLKTKLSLEQQDRESEKRTYKTRIEAVMNYNEEILKKNYRLEKALGLAMYYVEGDATHEGLKAQINDILDINKELK